MYTVQVSCKQKKIVGIWSSLAGKQLVGLGFTFVHNLIVHDLAPNRLLVSDYTLSFECNIVLILYLCTND